MMPKNAASVELVFLAHCSSLFAGEMTGDEIES